jgi:hypothetical protein
MSNRRNLAVASAALPLAALLAACQPKPVDGPSQVAGDMRFDYGLAPSAQVATHPTGHPEAAMHGGPLNAPHAYHVTLALFDAKTGARVTNANVTMGISGPGHPGVGATPMDPMTVNGAVTYGAYVTLPTEASYRLTFEARRYGPPATSARAAFLAQRPGEG